MVHIINKMCNISFHGNLLYRMYLSNGDNGIPLLRLTYTDCCGYAFYIILYYIILYDNIVYTILYHIKMYLFKNFLWKSLLTASLMNLYFSLVSNLA